MHRIKSTQEHTATKSCEKPQSSHLMTAPIFAAALCSSSNKAAVNRHPQVHYPLDAHYYSVVDEP
jgi:hypothetical protein